MCVSDCIGNAAEPSVRKCHRKFVMDAPGRRWIVEYSGSDTDSVCTG